MSELVHLVTQRQLWSYPVLRWITSTLAEVKTPLGKITVRPDDMLYGLTVEQAISKAYQEEKETLLELELEWAALDDRIKQLKKDLPKTLYLYKATIRGLPR